MKVYLDKDYRCHAQYAEGLTEAETDFFDDIKSEEYIGAFCFIPSGQTYVDKGGVIMTGEMIFSVLSPEQLDLLRLQAELADALAALDAIYGGETE